MGIWVAWEAKKSGEELQDIMTNARSMLAEMNQILLNVEAQAERALGQLSSVRTDMDSLSGSVSELRDQVSRAIAVIQESMEQAREAIIQSVSDVRQSVADTNESVRLLNDSIDAARLSIDSIRVSVEGTRDRIDAFEHTLSATVERAVSDNIARQGREFTQLMQENVEHIRNDIESVSTVLRAEQAQLEGKIESRDTEMQSRIDELGRVLEFVASSLLVSRMLRRVRDGRDRAALWLQETSLRVGVFAAVVTGGLMILGIYSLLEWML